MYFLLKYLIKYVLSDIPTMNDVKSVKCASKKLMNPKWRDWVDEVPVIISDKQMENDGETNLETGQVSSMS